jgi:hypothetical protein
MSNHFHLVVETPEANLVEGMRWLLSAYTIRLNHRHKLCGHVFSGRYKALLVESGNGYLKTVCDYVHLNPVRAGLLKPHERLLSYPWSSLTWYLATCAQRPAWIRVDRLLGEHGLPMESDEAIRTFEQHMEARRLENFEDEEYKAISRGWCCGTDAFRQEVLERLAERQGESQMGELRRESAQVRAERIIGEELQRLGWSQEELARRRKGDPGKMAMATRLRKETTLTVKSIAARLYLGTSYSASTRLHQWMRARAEETHSPEAGS